MNVITKSEAKAYLQLDHSDDDAFLDLIIPMLTADIIAHCHQDFTSSSRTERIDGDVTNLLVGHSPIASVTSVKDYAEPTSPVTILAADYSFDPISGEVYSVVAKWGSGRRRWEVIYVGGTNGFPVDVKFAALQIIAAVYAARDPKVIEDVLGDSEQTVEGNQHSGLAREVHSRLSRYVETGF